MLSAFFALPVTLTIIASLYFYSATPREGDSCDQRKINIDLIV